MLCKLIFFISIVHFSSQCVQIYIEQPLSNLDCSPYDNKLLTWRLMLACTVKRMEMDVSDGFDVFWYRKRTCDGVVQNLGTGTELPMGTLFKRIVLTEITGLSNVTFSEEMPGEYWCQAVTTNSSRMYVLTESDTLTVLRPDNYTGLKECVDIQSQFVGKCAEHTMNTPAPRLNQSMQCELQQIETSSAIAQGTEVCLDS